MMLLVWKRCATEKIKNFGYIQVQTDRETLFEAEFIRDIRSIAAQLCAWLVTRFILCFDLIMTIAKSN